MIFITYRQVRGHTLKLLTIGLQKREFLKTGPESRLDGTSPRIEMSRSHPVVEDGFVERRRPFGKNGRDLQESIFDNILVRVCQLQTGLKRIKRQGDQITPCPKYVLPPRWHLYQIFFSTSANLFSHSQNFIHFPKLLTRLEHNNPMTWNKKRLHRFWITAQPVGSLSCFKRSETCELDRLS